jgi:hypothetical protein
MSALSLSVENSPMARPREAMPFGTLLVPEPGSKRQQHSVFRLQRPDGQGHQSPAKLREGTNFDW